MQTGSGGQRQPHADSPPRQQQLKEALGAVVKIDIDESSGTESQVDVRAGESCDRSSVVRTAMPQDAEQSSHELGDFPGMPGDTCRRLLGPRVADLPRRSSISHATPCSAERTPSSSSSLTAGGRRSGSLLSAPSMNGEILEEGDKGEEGAARAQNGKKEGLRGGLSGFGETRFQWHEITASPFPGGQPGRCGCH